MLLIPVLRRSRRVVGYVTSQKRQGRCPGAFPALVIPVQFSAGTTCAAAAGDEHVCVLVTERITTAATVTATAAPTPTAVAPATPRPPAAPPAAPLTLVVLLISVTVIGVAGTGGVGAALNCTLEDSPAPTITHGPSIRPFLSFFCSSPAGAPPCSSFFSALYAQKF